MGSGVVGGGLVAFLGPSLDAAEARRIVPDVVLLPPVCQGDLTSAVLNLRPRAILVVDGEFGQALSVWHKEILDALDRGMRVLGASSMGALRAAELDRFGMEGVGAIYEHYRDGWLTNDADVALVHGSADDCYRALSWPTVNVRATAAALVEAGRLGAAEGAALLRLSSQIHFTARTRPVLARALLEAGHDRADADRLAGLVEEHYVDQKALDAAAGLALLAGVDDVPRPPREKPLHLTSKGFDALSYADVTVRRRAGTLRGYQLVDDAALHEPDFEELLHRAVDRTLLVHLSVDLDQRLSDQELAAARVRLLRRLSLTEQDVPAWMATCDLDEHRLARLVEHEARLFKLRRWMLGGVALEHNRRMVVEQLQLEGRYAAAADAAARRRRWADDRPEPAMPNTVQEVVELVAHQKALSGWSPDRLLTDLADEQGFGSLGSFYVALTDSRVASEVRQERLRKLNQVLGRGADRPAAGPAHRVQAMLEGHQVTQVLVAAIDLGVPAALAAGPHSTDELAHRLEVDAERLARLLAALAALGVLRRGGDDWQLTDEGRYLAPEGAQGSGSLLPYAAHLGALMDTWAGLADVVRGEALPEYPESAAADEHVAAGSTALGLTESVAEVLDLPPEARVVDLGGGLGHLAEAVVARHPGIHVVVAELPETAERARARLAGLGLDQRISVVSLDSRTDLGEPVDLCIIVRVLVTLDDEKAVKVLELARRSLAVGGRIESFEPELDGSPGAALSDVLNLVRSGGAVRPPDGWRALAARAGLRTVAREPFVPPFAHFTFEPEAAS